MPVQLPDDSAINTLRQGKLNLQGQFVWGSNYTLLVDVDMDGETIQAVYKPVRGERPLWDFPVSTLAHRETAAYLVSQALGWHLVPPTIYRRKGPVGAGSLQLFIDHDPDYHYFNFTPEDRQRLRPAVLFDLLINNADRKGSHVLLENGTRNIWLIDHGICFHQEDKLRTVIWDFAGEPIPDDLRGDVARLRSLLDRDGDLCEALRKHLSSIEIGMLTARADWLAQSTHFPDPPMNRRAHPWPPV